MKLNSDNPNTMPITDSVYGQGRGKPGKDSQPRGHSSQLWRTLPYTTFTALVRRGTKDTHKLRRDA